MKSKLLVTTFGPHTFLDPIWFIDFLELLEEDLRLEQYKEVTELIIVDYGKELWDTPEIRLQPFNFFREVLKAPIHVDESVLRNFRSGGGEGIDKAAIDRIEKVITQARIIRKDQLTDPSLLSELKKGKTIFHPDVFPKEFIDIFNSLPENKRVLVLKDISENDSDLYIKQVNRLQPIVNCPIFEKASFLFLKTLLKNIWRKRLNKIHYEKLVKYSSILLEFTWDFIKVFENASPLQNRAEQVYNNNYNYIFEYFERSLNDSSELKKVFDEMIRCIGILEMFNDPEFPSLYSSLEKEGFQENYAALQKKYCDAVEEYYSFNEYIEVFQEVGSVFRETMDSFFPEFLYKIFEEDSVKFFDDMRALSSECFIVECDDDELANYLVKDALKDKRDEYYLFNVKDSWTQPNRNYKYLIISDFKSLSKKGQLEIWATIRQSREFFSSVIIIVPTKGSAASIAGYPSTQTMLIKKFEDFKELKYKVFFYLLNIKYPFNKKSPESGVLFPFCLNQFDEYFNDITSFNILEKIISLLNDEFSYLDMMHPFFWYKFEKSKIKFNKALGLKSDIQPTDPPRYYVRYAYHYWEISFGYHDPILLENKIGLEYLFFTLHHKGVKFTPLELYNRFAKKKPKNSQKKPKNDKKKTTEDEDASVSIIRAKDRALVDLKEAEKKFQVGHNFSNKLQTAFNNGGWDFDLNKHVIFMNDDFTPDVKVYAPKGYLDL